MLELQNTNLKVKFKVLDGEGNILEAQEEDIKLKDLIGERNETIFGSRRKI